jgi:hypothetical protein
MGEWITGAAINVLGSVSINFGTNLLKLGHNQVRKKNAFFAKICFSSLANLSFAAVVFRNLRLGFFFPECCGCLKLLSNSGEKKVLVLLGRP